MRTRSVLVIEPAKSWQRLQAASNNPCSALAKEWIENDPLTEIRSGKFECTSFRVNQSEVMHKYFLRTKRLMTE